MKRREGRAAGRTFRAGCAEGERAGRTLIVARASCPCSRRRRFNAGGGELTPDAGDLNPHAGEQTKATGDILCAQV